MAKYISIDLGAESGRIIVATLAEERLELEEVYRFANGVVQVGEGLYWDVLHLWQEIKTGLRKAAAQHAGEIRSLAVDTWGIDYALLDRRGDLVGNPHAYRDPRRPACWKPPWRRWVAGRSTARAAAFSSCRSIRSINSTPWCRPATPPLEIADTLLMIPDLFGYWLTGERKCEFTDATSTQFYDGRARRWSTLAARDVGHPGPHLA